MVRGVQEAAEASSREGLRLAEEAVNRAVVSCYSLDGVYPASYAELKKKVDWLSTRKNTRFSMTFLPPISVLP